MAQHDLDIPIFDALDGLAPPHQQTHFFAHEEQEKALLNAWLSEKMHHAWLLTGPKGIGKATFAYRAARFIFDHGSMGQGASLIEPSSLYIHPDNHAARQVANRAHPNLLSIERPYDAKAKKFRTEITVDEVRKTVRFFGSTAGENTWRVCIVDPADDLNANAANALLKILEEPPVKTVFFLISHAPGKLLPTIRSRCRRLNFAPLENPTLSMALSKLDIASEETVEHISQICEGSLRQAAELQSEDGLIMVHAFERLLVPPFKPDYESLHHFGDLVAQRGKEQNFAKFSDLVFRYLSAQLHQKRSQTSPSTNSMMALANAWENAGESLRETQIFNLDKKQTAINVVRLLAEASRA
ncbi:MAG: DNA polymerase III subunit delta' [Cohaesibacter sp.]|nr:DNA polymerase III subunit delta' [Cohaesibacter sp.]